MAKKLKAGTSKSAAEHRRGLFVEAYIRSGLNGGKLNGKQAAIAAGFSPHTAESQASRLLRNVKVQQQILERKGQILAEAQRTTQLTAEEVLEDLARGMRFNPKLLHKNDDSFLRMSEIPDELASQLEGCESEEIYRGRGAKRKLVARLVKVKYPKRVGVREQAMKFFGLFKTHQEQAGRAAGKAVGEAAGRAVAEALDFNEIEKRVEAKIRARRRGR